MNKRLIAAIVSLIVIISLMLGIYVSSAYDTAGQIEEPSTDEPAALTGIEFEQDTYELKVGAQIKLTVKPVPESAALPEIAFSTEDGETVRLEADGTVTALKAGSATVTASVEGGEFTCTCTVTVTEAETETAEPVVLTGIEFEHEAYELKTGEQLQLTVKPIPEEAELPELTFASEDGETVQIDENGMITALKTGETTVTASAGDFTCSCTVTVLPPDMTGIAFEYETYRIHVGDSVQLVVKPIPEEVELPALSFYTSDDEKAEVSPEGVVTAVKNGRVTITAVTTEGEFICTCTVIISSSDLRFTVINETGEKIIAGFRLGSAVTDIVTDICTSEEIEREEVVVKNADGTEAAANASVATGMIFSVSGVEYTAIIYGDVNGDGMINANDTQTIADYITGKITLDRAFLIAADLRGDGNITIENALMIQRHVYGLALIEQ